MKRKNGWFVAAGVLSAVEALAILGCELFFLISFLVSYFSADNGVAEAAIAFISVVLGLCLVPLLVVFVFAVCNAVLYFRNASKTYEQLHQKGSIIALIVLSFIFGVIIVGILGLLGYVLKPKEENTPVENA